MINDSKAIVVFFLIDFDCIVAILVEDVGFMAMDLDNGFVRDDILL